MLPIEHAHYFACADRLERALWLAYPGTTWLVADLDDVVPQPMGHDASRSFCVVALTFDHSRHVTVQVPYTLVVDDARFPLIVKALGQALERWLRANVGEG